MNEAEDGDVTEGEITSFSSALRCAYSCPASFAACATFNFRLPVACCFWIQSVK